MLVAILVGVAVGLGLFVSVVARRPSAYHVERRLQVAAPAAVVFGALNDLHQFVGLLALFGSLLEKQDPNMQKTFDGPATGVGQSLAWSGNKDVGRGRMTIEESVPGQRVGIRLAFEAPMESTATCTLTVAGTPGGSFVTWSMDGSHNFVGKALGVFVNMDNMLGSDLEKGLAELKSRVECKQGAAVAAPAERVAR